MMRRLCCCALLSRCAAQHPLAVSAGGLRALEARRVEDGLAEVGGARLIDADGRRANLFEAGGEVLLVPEVASDLRFERRAFARRGDGAGERAVRDACAFGHVLVDGGFRERLVRFIVGSLNSP